ncbi:hypothetical protein [Desulfuribacillus alkaliarsenatis]|uniref:DUF2229 domain-containing protein n=1 Tax=Desulfuribacillus alkaliarsenatis TaxID=766136 RepID=A0A1E5G5L9_9FIRM|nr:hypothetical protein [Desulfuribacillus alkaliarsenatis]OEF98487.1 hypothetical protein BHF68_02095 [Desulfuribacillus alkaliarsenatis]
MKVTFPHMGSFYVGIKALFEALDVEVVVPPPITKRTMTLGSINGPESACLPLKINLGNFIEAIEKGADTVVMAGGHGPCRFGYFAQVHREILTDLGYNVNVLVIEQPKTGRKDFFKSIKSYFPDKSWLQLLKAIHFGWKKVNALDSIEGRILKNRAYEIISGSHSALWKKAIVKVDAATTNAEIETVYNQLVVELDAIPKDYNRDVLQMAVIGEIYLMLEPTANLNVDEKLGNLGVSLIRTEYVSDYIREKVFKTQSNKQLFKLAKPYMRNEFGGHGLHTIANTIKYGRKGFDGVVQIMPFTCVPEIVSMAVLDHVTEKENIPALSLIFDEHSGEAGVDTRLEAFVDLVRRKKKQKKEVLV